MNLACQRDGKNVTKRGVRTGAAALYPHHGLWILVGERQLQHTVLRCNTGKENQLVDLVSGSGGLACGEAAVAS